MSDEVVTTPPSATDGAIATAGAAAGAFHGWKRTQSIGWAIFWGACGSVAPVITTAIAFAQGFAEPAKKHNPTELPTKPKRALATAPAPSDRSMMDWWAQ